MVRNFRHLSVASVCAAVLFSAGPVAALPQNYPIEFDETETIFTRPADKRTEDYVTGRFG